MRFRRKKKVLQTFVTLDELKQKGIKEAAQELGTGILISFNEVGDALLENYKRVEKEGEQ